MGAFGTGITGVNLNGSEFGLGSGIDVQSTVQALIQAASAGENVYLQEQSTYTSEASALTSITGLLSSLQSAAQALEDPAGALVARVVDSSDSNVVTGTADSGIAIGTYSVVVSALALTSTYTSNTLASSSSNVGDGTLQYSINGTPYSVAVSAANDNDTLSSLASYINSGKYGVTAAVVTEANGATLALTSNTGGQPGEITITSNTTGLSLAEVVQGTNASLSVDGIPVTSTSDTVSGVIPGLTFDLMGTSASPVTVSVTPDSNQASAAINNFVSAYNAVAQAINQQFTYSADATSEPPLLSDTTLQQAQQTLTTDINYFLGSNGSINSLASIGVNLQQDGTLQVDNNTLNTVLADNPTAVETFFQGSGSNPGFAGQLSNDINTLAAPGTGALTLDLQGINQQEQSITQTINQFNANLQQEQEQLTAEYTQVNVTLQQMPLLLAALGLSSTSSSSSSTTGGGLG